MTEHRLTITRKLPASPEAVFDAWTTADQLANWCSPMTTASVPKLELRVGGEYRIDMHGEEKDYVHTGKYIEIDRPNKLVFSWFSEGTQQQETIVTLEFKPDAEGTLLSLTHERFPTAESRDNHERGWTEIVDKLEHFMAQANTGA
jgi:uncharacterized protein YndB with AHSA1/START domain